MNMKFKKRIKMFEEFASPADTSSNSNTTANKTAVSVEKTTKATAKSGEAIRTEVIKDVDAILTNLAELSNQITESYEMVNEAGIEDLMKGIQSTFAIAKAKMMLDKYGKLLMAADPTNQKNQVTIGTAKIEAEIEKIQASIEGKGIAPEVKEKAYKKKAELEQRIAGATEKAAMEVEKAKNALSEFEQKLADVEKPINADSPLAKEYQASKARLKNAVREESMKVAAELAAKQGNEKAAKQLEQELKDMQTKQKELEDKIKNQQELGKEEIAELKGIQAYIAEIDAIMKAREAVKKVNDDAKTTANAIKESLSAFNAIILESAVSDLFSKAKAKSDEAALAKAKELATSAKAAATAELEAVAALANKIKGKEVTKSVVGLAGGDMDKAQEGEGGFTLGEFIPKYGDGSTLKKPEELSAVQAADQVLQDVDQAIADAKEAGKGGGEENKSSQTLADEFIAGNEGFKVISAEEKDAKVTVNNPETGEDEEKPKYEGVKEFKGKKEDGSDDEPIIVAKEINYSENSSAQVSAGDNVSEEEAVCEKCGEVHEGECATHEAVTESFAFKSGSVADRFRSLM